MPGRLAGATTPAAWPVHEGLDLAAVLPPESGVTEWLYAVDPHEGWCAVTHPVAIGRARARVRRRAVSHDLALGRLRRLARPLRAADGAVDEPARWPRPERRRRHGRLDRRRRRDRDRRHGDGARRPGGPDSGTAYPVCMIETIPFGATGHRSSRVIFGAAALGNVSQDEADDALTLLLRARDQPHRHRGELRRVGAQARALVSRAP